MRVPSFATTIPATPSGRRLSFTRRIFVWPGGAKSNRRIALNLLIIDDALKRLAEANARAAQVVERRFFAGLTLDETAASLGLSMKTVQRDWTLARAWLQKEIERLRAEHRAPEA